MMQSSLQPFLLTPPDRVEQAQAHGLPLAHMAFQLGGDGHLHLSPLPPTLQGGLMLVGGPGPAEPADPRIAVREMLSVCHNRKFGGIVLDLESPPTPYLARLIRGLEDGLTRQNRSLVLPEAYANYSSRAFLFFSSALSGGSLRRRLEEAIEAYGADRLVLSLTRVCEDFFLPARKGEGHPLTQQELRGRIARMEPTIFYSRDLCAHYFTYMSRESGAHFILFDDEVSLRKKRALAQELGISRFFLLYPEVEEFLPQLIDEKETRSGLS